MALLLRSRRAAGLAHAVAAGALGFVLRFVGLVQQGLCVVVRGEPAAGHADADGEMAAAVAGNRHGVPRDARAQPFGEGQGGVAGFAKGEAEVLLTPEDGQTALAYTAKANIGGKLAQIGQRLIDGAARRRRPAFA